VDFIIAGEVELFVAEDLEIGETALHFLRPQHKMIAIRPCWFAFDSNQDLTRF